LSDNRKFSKLYLKLEKKNDTDKRTQLRRKKIKIENKLGFSPEGVLVWAPREADGCDFRAEQ
jgi:hypothetical protein